MSQPTPSPGRTVLDSAARWTMPEPAKDKDKSAKWLIEHHGDAILRLGGVTDLVRWQAAPAELVLPTKLPDGLLFAWRRRDHPEPFVVEIATYPELRGRAGTTRLAAGLPRSRRGRQRSRVGTPPQGAAPRPRPRPPPGFGRRDGAGGLVAGGRVVDAARRASAGDVGSGDDALGAAHARGRTARDRATAVPRGDRPAPPAEEHESLITVTQVFTRLRTRTPTYYPSWEGKPS